MDGSAPASRDEDAGAGSGAGAGDITPIETSVGVGESQRQGQGIRSQTFSKIPRRLDPDNASLASIPTRFAEPTTRASIAASLIVEEEGEDGTIRRVPQDDATGGFCSVSLMGLDDEDGYVHFNHSQPGSQSCSVCVMTPDRLGKLMSNLAMPVQVTHSFETWSLFIKSIGSVGVILTLGSC